MSCNQLLMEFSTLCGLIEGNREFRVKRGRRERREGRGERGEIVREHSESPLRQSVNPLPLCALQVVPPVSESPLAMALENPYHFTFSLRAAA